MSRATDQIMPYCLPMENRKKLNQQSLSSFTFETDTQPLEPNDAMNQNDDIFLLISSVLSNFVFGRFSRKI